MTNQPKCDACGDAIDQHDDHHANAWTDDGLCPVCRADDQQERERTNAPLPPSAADPV